MTYKRLFELLRIGVAIVLMASATASSAEIGQLPDPELAWEYRDFRAVEDWLAQHDGAGSESVETLRARAWLARRAGDSERALGLIDQAVARAPDLADLRVDRASFRSDLLDEAGPFKSLRIARDIRDDLEHAVSVSPGHVDALVALASFHQRAPGIAGGNEHYAETLMERLDQLAPERTHLRVAMQQAGQKRYDEAVARMSQAIDTAEQIRPKWFLRKGRWLMEIEQYAPATQCFQRALDNAPRFGPALYELGRLAAQGQGDPVEGLAALRAYLELPSWPGDPDHALAWLHLGRIEARQGRAAEAREAFRRALDLDPDLKQARQALNELSP